MLKRSKILFVVPAVAILLAACSQGSTGAAPAASGGPQTIQITALDSLKFDPSSVTVRAGEPVRFVVTNSGSTDHEFILGDEETQMAHEGEMGSGGSMGGMDMDLPSLSLAPGETKEATVTFDEPGTILYGCHMHGHYGGGMAGTITVT